MYHSLQARISFGVRNKGLTPKGDFNPPQTSEERVFQRRRGPKIWPLACHESIPTFLTKFEFMSKSPIISLEPSVFKYGDVSTFGIFAISVST